MIKRNSLKNGAFKIALLFSVVFLFACEKEELPINPYDRGSLETTSLVMESDYRYQFFFDLETNTVVGQNLKTIWDLGFECSTEGYHVILNSANFMSIKRTSSSDFSINYPNEFTTDILVAEIDVPSGDLDSTAIGEWVGEEEVFLIHRGYSPTGIDLGVKKIVFQSVDENQYAVKFADLDGANEVSMIIPKADNYNFSFLSFNGGGEVVAVEPPKEDWDLVFTRHTEILVSEGDDIVYGVTSVLNNRYQVESARDFESEFSDISFDDVSGYTFYPAINTIGHEWKFFSFTEGFLVFSEQNFIIKSTEDKFFKLHFIDFYDSEGNKGTPTFEFQEL